MAEEGQWADQIESDPSFVDAALEVPDEDRLHRQQLEVREGQKGDELREGYAIDAAAPAVHRGPHDLEQKDLEKAAEQEADDLNAVGVGDGELELRKLHVAAQRPFRAAHASASSGRS